MLRGDVRSGREPGASSADLGLRQIGGADEISQIVDSVIAANPKAVADYRAGKQEAVKFLVGQVMRETKGRANPRDAAERILTAAAGRRTDRLIIDLFRNAVSCDRLAANMRQLHARTRSFIKWFYFGMHIKRWLLLLLVGVAIMGLGFGYFLREVYVSYTFPDWVYYLTLQFLPRYVRVAPCSSAPRSASSGSPSGS